MKAGNVFVLALAVFQNKLGLVWGIEAGIKVNAKEAPWMVRLDNGYRRRCAGVIIDPEWILTSFWCAEYNVGKVSDPLTHDGLVHLIFSPTKVNIDFLLLL